MRKRFFPEKFDLIRVTGGLYAVLEAPEGEKKITVDAPDSRSSVMSYPEGRTIWIAFKQTDLRRNLGAVKPTLVFVPAGCDISIEARDGAQAVKV